jgi:hypothetical protein
MSFERHCLTCGAVVINCTSFTLARDMIAALEGKRLDRIREFCGICDLTGKMQEWVRNNPRDT